MILRIKNDKEEVKEYSFTATMKKIVALNKKFKVQNIRDAFFKAFNDINFEFLAEVLLTFADDDTKKELNGDSNKVYDLMENYVSQSEADYESLFKLLAEEINDKSFFGKKMTKKELEEQLENPLAGFDICEIMNRTTEKVIGDVVAEEFKGYRG